jgi:uncharacterized membrane protein YgcG
VNAFHNLSQFMLCSSPGNPLHMHKRMDFAPPPDGEELFNLMKVLSSHLIDRAWNAITTAEPQQIVFFMIFTLITITMMLGGGIKGIVGGSGGDGFDGGGDGGGGGGGDGGG